MSRSADFATALARELEGMKREVSAFPDDASLWKTLPGVTAVGDPFAPGGLVSPDGSTAVVSIAYDLDPEKVTQATLNHLRAAMSPVRPTAGSSWRRSRR